MGHLISPAIPLAIAEPGSEGDEIGVTITGDEVRVTKSR
jgi:hypothetical protein